MAVTQQIARIPNKLLEKCRTDEEALQELLSYRLLPKRDYLDLDWAPAGLAKYFKGSQQSERVRESLKIALNGSALLNADSPLGPRSDPVYSEVRVLSPDEVKQVSEAFQDIDQSAFLDWLPADPVEANAIIEDELTVHPNVYYSAHLSNLLKFYKVAAKKGMAVVVWWD